MRPVLHFDSEKVQLGGLRLDDGRWESAPCEAPCAAQGFMQTLTGELINTTVYPPLYMIFTELLGVC